MKAPLKIALLIPSISSVKAFFLPLLAAQSEDIQFHLITSQIHAFEEVGAIPSHVKVHFVPDFRSLSLFKVFKARRSIKHALLGISPDIVHVHFIIASVVLATIKLKAKKWITLHGVYHLGDKSLKGWIVGLLEKWAIRKADRADVLNSSDFNHMKHLKNVYLLPLPGVGVNIEKFDACNFNDYAKGKIRERLGLRKEDIVLLYVGRYTDFKGYPTVLKAAKRLEKYPKVRVLTCGAVDGLHGKKSEDEIQQSNLNDLGWSNEIEKFMSIADLLIFPSKREGLPVSIMESLTMNLPVLAYKLRGVEDLIEDGENGFLIDNCNEQLFLERLEELIQSPEVIFKIKQKLARQTVSYSNEIYVAQQLSTYLSKS